MRWGELRETKVRGEWFTSRADLLDPAGRLALRQGMDAHVEARKLRAREAKIHALVSWSVFIAMWRGYQSGRRL